MIALSRQKLPFVTEVFAKKNMSNLGGYELKKTDPNPEVTLIASGSEVELALNVHDALKENNGVILVGGHFGSFHKLIVTMARKGYKNIAGVSYKQNNQAASKFFVELRKEYVANELHKGGPSSDVKQSLQNNELLVLLSDQDAGKKGVFVNFFNIPSSTPSGAAHYNKKMRSPLIFFSAAKTNNGYKANFERIDTNNKSIEEIVQKYTSLLEQEIKESPEQYFWVHKRWKTKKV